MNSCIPRFARTTVLILSLIALSMPAIPAERGKGGERGKAGHEKEHPAMHEALDALRKAKASADPVADLKDARQRLNAGLHNKEGYRVEAIQIVDKAIAETNAKHRVEAGKLIDEAISKVEKAVAVSPQR
jgi:hypothetical protein